MINDTIRLGRPEELQAILTDTAALGFTMQCEDQTGALLRLLAAAKPGGSFLEIGTGTGVSTCWLLAGMSAGSHLTTVEIDGNYQNVARRHLGHHGNLKFHQGDAVDFIEGCGEKYDLVFADTFPGKFTHREQVLASIAPGGFYVVDDLIPQANWPEDDHPLKVRALVAALESDDRFEKLKLNWASGIVVAVRKSYG